MYLTLCTYTLRFYNWCIFITCVCIKYAVTQFIWTSVYNNYINDVQIWNQIQLNLVISQFAGPLQNFELSETRLKRSNGLSKIGTLSGKFNKSGCKLMLLDIYNISVIICTYCVSIFKKIKNLRLSDEVLLWLIYLNFTTYKFNNCQKLRERNETCIW